MYYGAFINVWVLNLANLSETRTLCQIVSTDPMFSVIFRPHQPALILEREIFRKTNIKKTMVLATLCNDLPL